MQQCNLVIFSNFYCIQQECFNAFFKKFKQEVVYKFIFHVK